jgi:hypothetical protein
MACIILEGPSGRRLVEENTPYRRLVDEKIVGVDWECRSGESSSVDEELAKQGLKLGDAVAWVTKKIGLKQCAPCKARQEILNNVEKVGWVETLRQIKETL